MKLDDELRKELKDLIVGGHAHLTFSHTVADFPAKLRGIRPKGLPYSGWEILEHMRIAQNDILNFIRDPKYKSPSWPEGYCPESQSPPNSKSWNQSIKEFEADQKALLRLIANTRKELTKPFTHGTGQTLLREALLVADHTSYHLGEMLVLRRLLGAWKDK